MLSIVPTLDVTENVASSSTHCFVLVVTAAAQKDPKVGSWERGVICKIGDVCAESKRN